MKGVVLATETMIADRNGDIRLLFGFPWDSLADFRRIRGRLRQIATELGATKLRFRLYRDAFSQRLVYHAFEVVK